MEGQVSATSSRDPTRLEGRVADADSRCRGPLQPDRHQSRDQAVRGTPRLPEFAAVHHRGRKSGHRHRTPVNIFAGPDGRVAALTYGPDCDRVRNVIAAGGEGLQIVSTYHPGRQALWSKDPASRQARVQDRIHAYARVGQTLR
jgi:hypothetical protein